WHLAVPNPLKPGAKKPSSLALGGSVSGPLPQSVPADLFHQIEAAVAAGSASASLGPAGPDAARCPQPAGGPAPPPPG
ncbi:cellulose biosynthesis protein BcsO, partial [Klebsiella pneumoniae]|nr:cellulose biosynthesis protein BcsO [Klebsiella pneumoniae]